MRWNNPLSDPDELSEIAQFLGYATGTEAIIDYLGKGNEIADFPRYVDDCLIQQQQAAAAAAVKELEQAEVNGIPLFHFKEGTLESMVTALIGLTNGRTVDNARHLSESRAPRRTLQGFKLNGTYYEVGSFSEMLLMTVKQLLLLPDSVQKLNQVNGAISTDKTKLNPNGKIVQVGLNDENGTLHNLYVDVKKSADQLEDLAKRCAKACGQTLEVVV